MNQQYKKLIALLSKLMDEQLDWNGYVLNALHNAGYTSYSKSRVHGWRVSENNKNFVKMTDDDLLNVLDALCKYHPT